MAAYHFRTAQGASADAPLLFLFHGTGGNENQLFELASELAPGAGRIAPRGDVDEQGALRYFRRTGEGVYDMEDLARRTTAMADFVREQAEQRRAGAVWGLGYSNGANILAAVQFAAPDLFSRSVLMHPLIPFAPPKAAFAGRRVLITAGRGDAIAPAPATQTLADYFERHGAATELVWHGGGHELRREELIAAQRFFAS